jgi:hypothetical protein
LRLRRLIKNQTKGKEIMKKMNEKWLAFGICVLAAAAASAQTNCFVPISDSYYVQYPTNVTLGQRFTVTNGTYTCWVFGTDSPSAQTGNTLPRTEMRWSTWTNQTVANQFAFDEQFSAGTEETCIHQIKSDNKGDGSGGEAVYLQVNQPGTLRQSVGPDFATGMANTWFHINSIYDPLTGVALLYYNGALVYGTTNYTYPDGNWYFKTGVYDNGMPTNAEAWVQIKNVVHWLQTFPGTYQIENASSGLSLNVSNNITANGACIVQYSYSGSSNEKWTFTPTSNGYYQMVSVLSGKDAVVQGASTANGAKIVQWTFGSSGDDQWQPVMNTNGTYTFYNLNSGKSLEDPGSSTSKNTQMDQYSFDGGANQEWNLISQ